VSYRIRFTGEALEALERLYDFVIERELERGGELTLAERAIEAIEAIESDVATLSFSPFTCRKAGGSPFIREMVIPFGASRLHRALRDRIERFNRHRSCEAPARG